MPESTPFGGKGLSIEGPLANTAPPNCTSQIIDFSKTTLPEYSQSFALLIHNLLTAAECTALLNAAESKTGKQWEQAMINIGNGRQMLATDTRNCGRIIWDDRAIAGQLLDRILPFLPPQIVTLKQNPLITGHGPSKRKETWRISRLNERLRFLKYTHGMYFREHCDGSYITPDGKEVSFVTVHVYLNGDGDNKEDSFGYIKQNDPNLPIDELPLQGGSTRFFSDYDQRYLDVVPATGTCLVFQHRGLVHSGEEVLQGTKYTVRTDVMYEKVD